MGLFSKKKEIVITKEYESLLSFEDFYNGLTNNDRYVAKSEYKNEIGKFEKTYNFFNVLKDSGLLNDYSKKNGLDENRITGLSNRYVTFEKLIDKHNEEFIKYNLNSKKEYLDNILKDIDSNIVLDNNQREVVLTDEDYCLVIAGAGAGKTTTVAAKAKYLVEKLNVPENEILIVSFTNKAVEELREKINRGLKLEHVIISTFHSIGNAIIKNQSSEKINIARENSMYYILLNYFKSAVLTDESLTKKLVLFFATYFDVPYEGDNLQEYFGEMRRTNLVTLKSDFNEYKKEIINKRSKKKETINNEIVRSIQEVQIANFLYLNNIEYEYEPAYRYNIRYANKPYTPDFLIKQDDKEFYIEHFGINQRGENPLYKQTELDKYKKAINDKITLHKQHQTNLIYTFSEYNDGRTLLQHLEEELTKNGFILKRKDDKEVLQKIIDTEENKYVSKLIILVSRFINLFKTNGFNQEKFDEFRNQTKNVRNQLFLDVCKGCYLEYERVLKEKNSIDFQDMINNSAVLLEQMAENKEKLHFKYVIVDEYQDISRQRFDLVGALRKVCNAKVMAVGDDWQSIYAFSGSDVELFLEFQKKMGYAKILKIENTYRNSQEIIDIAGTFIQKNDTQIKKSLKSPKHIKDPFIIYTYDASRKKVDEINKTGANYNLATAVECCLDDILERCKNENKECGRTLILGRYGFDGNHLEKSGQFELPNKQGKIISVKHKDMDITFMTAHSSKGLGYDNVIIINCENSKFGFPSKIQDDPVLKHVLIEDNSYAYAEERRLFYVAMTRTKNRVYCVAPQRNPSEFLIEVNKEYDNVIKVGEWEENNANYVYQKTCPKCGYPLIYKHKPAYGLRLYICSNEPEICGYITNDLKSGLMQIMKCDQCIDGYLVAKPSTNGIVLGCTNYKKDGTGCNNLITYEKYCKMQNLAPSGPVYIKNNKPNNKLKNNAFNENEQKIEVQEYSLKDIKKSEDFYNLTKIIISCVSKVSQKKYFGIHVYSDILFGIENPKLKFMNFNKLKEYGSLAKCDKKEIEILMYSMVKAKLLIYTKENYPVIHPSINCVEYIKEYNKETIIKLYKIFRKDLESINNQN